MSTWTKKVQNDFQFSYQIIDDKFCYIGPEKLLRQASSLDNTTTSDMYSEADGGDVIEPHEWKCVRTINGIFFVHLLSLTSLLEYYFFVFTFMFYQFFFPS